MPTESALQFTEEGQFSQVRAFAGEILYTEGMPAAHMYVIKDGEVDLYLVRDEKRIVVETLKRGDCFGFEPHLTQAIRVQSAAARTYCELFLIDRESVIDAIDGCSDLAIGLLGTLSDRLAVAQRLITTRVNYQSDLLIYAQLLYLLGIAELGPQSAKRRGLGGESAGRIARPSLQDVVQNARIMFGHSDRHIHACLGKLLSLHLIRIEDESGAGKQVMFAPQTIVAQVRRVVNGDVENDKLTYEYMSLNEFAALVEVDRNIILRKLSAAEFSDDVFTFRRDEILRLLDTKGRRFFSERKIKPPSEFSEVADLEHADQKSIFAAVSKVDTFDLAKLLAVSGDGPVRSKILQSLSRRRREEVESDLKDIGTVDPVEVHHIGKGLVAEIKELMTASTS